MTCVRSGLAALVAYLAVHVLGVVVRGIMGAAVLLQAREEYLGSWGVQHLGSADLLRCHRAAGFCCGRRGSPGLPSICWSPCVARGGALCCQRISQISAVVICDVCWCRFHQQTVGPQ